MQIRNPRLDVLTRSRKEKSSLLRLVFANGTLTVDVNQTLPGRGFYIQKDKATFLLPKSQKSLERILRRPLTEEETAAILEELA